MEHVKVTKSLIKTDRVKRITDFLQNIQFLDVVLRATMERKINNTKK